MTRNAMTFDDFHRTLANPRVPETFDLALQAIWWSARGDWDRAHCCVQLREGEPACDLVHAYLHRAQGDLDNAAYWYRRAGRTLASMPIDDERAAIVRELLAR